MKMQCKNCNSRIGPSYRYCSNCGESTFNLGYGDEDGHQIENQSIAENRPHTRVGFINNGLSTVGVYLDKSTIRDATGWINSNKTSNHFSNPIILETGGRSEMTCYLNGEVLKQKIDNLSAINDSESKASIDFFTTHTEYDYKTNSWSFFKISFDIYLSQPPFLRPEHTLYRYIWWESLKKGDSIAFPLDICNFSTEDIHVHDIEIHDAENDSPIEVLYDIPERKIAGIERVPISDVIDPSDYKGRSFKVKSRVKHSLSLPLVDFERRSGNLIRFLGTVRCEVTETSQTLKSTIGGLIGNAPRVRPLEWNKLITELALPLTITVENPGHLPILVTGLSLYRSKFNSENVERIEEVSADWLQILNFPSAPFTIQPFEQISFDVKIDISKRDLKLDKGEYGYRNIEIHHETERHFPCRIPFQVKLGQSRQTGYIGIDFGTTNSVICFTNPEFDEDGIQVETLKIEPKRTEGSIEQLRSLLFYTSDNSQRYAFGEEANTRSGEAPHNLIRSMKTVVNQNPGESITFIHKEGVERLIEVKIQDLLNAFINEMKIRSEDCIGNFSDEMKENIGIPVSTNVQIQEALFTHPVDISDDAINALYLAAQHCGLNQSITNIEDFREICCIDESTAALISFVKHILDGHEVELEDKYYDCIENSGKVNILCIDVGGGTTDVSTVSVEQDGDTNILNILRSVGNARFGGDDIDMLLAKKILELLNTKNNDTEKIARISHALDFFTLNSFTQNQINLYKRSRTSINQEKIKDIRTEAREIYSLSQILKRLSERAKIDLSVKTKTSVVLAKLGLGTPKVEFTKGQFDNLIRICIDKVTSTITKALGISHWRVEDVDFLLFTGQTTRITTFRQEIISSLRKRTKSDFLVIDPDSSAFDPKVCVSEGAIIYRQWLKNAQVHIEDLRPDKPLPQAAAGKMLCDIMDSRNPRASAIKGLEKDVELPASGTVSFRLPKKTFQLYRRGERKPFVKIVFSSPIQTADITFNNLNDITVTGHHVDGPVVGAVSLIE